MSFIFGSAPQDYTALPAFPFPGFCPDFMALLKALLKNVPSDGPLLRT